MIQGAVLHPGRERIAYTLSPTAEIDHSTVQLTDFQGAEHVPLGLDETAGVRDWTGSDLLVEVATMSTARPNIGWVTVPPEALNGTPEVTVRTVGSADLIEHPLGWLGGQRILAERRTREGTLEPVLYHRSGTATTVPIPPGVGDFIGEGYGAELTDGALAVGLETPHRGRGLYRFDPSTAELTHVDGPTASGSAATDRISHTVLERPQGVKVGVVTVRPRSPAASVPAVVRIPDRPQRQAWAGFDPVDAVFRACGIAVVRVTPRGGGAYLGGETDLRGTFGRGDQDDVAAAAEWATDRDWIDPTRIAIAGRHYGGFTTLHQLSRETTPFSAGVAWGSLVDLPALVRDDRAAERMVAALDRWLGELDRAEWRERSPISRADNLSGALGLVHELDDSLVPAEQSARLHQQMTRRADVDTEGYAYSRVESRQAARRFLLRFLVDRLASLGG